ncbi:MAG: transposase [Solobacterium sp.]|nr:transposase [Solobacterium sp.]
MKVPRYYASSQTCQPCGKRSNCQSMGMSQCHIVHDRDCNACINILNKGLEILRTVA